MPTAASWNIFSPTRSNCGERPLGYNSRLASTPTRIPTHAASRSRNVDGLRRAPVADGPVIERCAITGVELIDEQQRANATRPVSQHTAQGARAGVDLPGQRHQAARSDRIIRPIRG